MKATDGWPRVQRWQHLGWPNPLRVCSTRRVGDSLPVPPVAGLHVGLAVLSLSLSRGFLRATQTPRNKALIYFLTNGMNMII